MDDNEDESIFPWFDDSDIDSPGDESVNRVTASFQDIDGNWHDFTGDVRGLNVSDEWFLDAEHKKAFDQALSDMMADIGREFDAWMTSAMDTPVSHMGSREQWVGSDDLEPVETLVNPVCLN